jgi:hypothetical protein|tara:strand:- start:455 stop:556 length:102 start_codon:yes stop_codon:yes gene_type:complete
LKVRKIKHFSRKFFIVAAAAAAAAERIFLENID